VSTYSRYSEDPTGANPDNLVSPELHSLTNRKIRVIIPKYAPFFTKDLALYDNLTQRRLVAGTDYRIPVISREATLRYGLEVADAILIENTDVASQVRIGYQCVGGDIQNNIDNIVNIYESFLNDNRSVDWVTGLLGKPTEYPPSEHAHYLSEVFGFEPIVFELERIAQAITLGNAPAFEGILQAMKEQIVTEADIDSGKAVAKYMTLERMIYALDKFNFNTMTMTPNEVSLANGKSQWFEVAATNVADKVSYFWTIKHEGTMPADFAANSGNVSLVNGKGSFMIQVVKSQASENDETFRLELRKGGVLGHVLMTTPAMTLKGHSSYYDDRILEAVRIEDINSPRLRLTAKTHAAHKGAWNADFN